MRIKQIRSDDDLFSNIICLFSEQDWLILFRDTMNTKIDCFDKNVNTSHKKLEVCRLCGEMSLDYFPIFEDKENYIPEKISRCLPIFVSCTILYILYRF